MNANVAPEQLRKMNHSGYIDYQDCKYPGRRGMLRSGHNSYQMKKDGPRISVGGFEIVDLRTPRRSARSRSNSGPNPVFP